MIALSGRHHLGKYEVADSWRDVSLGRDRTHMVRSTQVVGDMDVTRAGLVGWTGRCVAYQHALTDRLWSVQGVVGELLLLSVAVAA